MEKGLFVTGTDTNVGKTVIAAGLAGLFKEKRLKVGVMKPIQTGAIKRNGKLVSPDIELMIKTSGITEDIDLLNPYCLEPPLAPLVASQITGVKIDIEKILEAYSKLKANYEIVIVEGAGGLLVPILSNYLMIDLIKDLDLPVLIVAKPSLGTINHTLLTIREAQAQGIRVLGVVINGLKEDKAGIAEQTNPQVIEELSKIPILAVIPYSPNISLEKGEPGNIVELLKEKMRPDILRVDDY
ncbi:MAG: dethiobiotin synthase [bacterium]|nr:dethiobiotin synthase [bacterium]